MKYSIVKYVHKDLIGWQKYLDKHITYLNKQVEKGYIVASGPIENGSTTQNEAFLIFNISNKEKLLKILSADPFWEQGLIDEYSIDIWEPWFGDLKNLHIDQK